MLGFTVIKNAILRAIQPNNLFMACDVYQRKIAQVGLTGEISKVTPITNPLVAYDITKQS